MSQQGLEASIEKMRRDGVADAAVETFRHYYRRLEAGDQGVLPEADLDPVEEVPDAEALPEAGEDGRAALERTVVLKLNGGLGTSMGMDRAKSLLEVKDGLSFLDITARQVLELRRRHGARLPLVLMDSFSTREHSLAALRGHEGLEADLPLDFLQNKEPKLLAEDLTPASWPQDPRLEWAPPGHGDLYTALVTSGMLERMRERGYDYAFVSNSDNLGAVLDPQVLAWFAREELPFAMEVCDRTEADRKGGHIARRRDGGGLVLRESAQTPEDDLDAFQDIARHRFFNTNNLWVDLRMLARVMEERGGVLGLPMIVNRKTLDPADTSTPAVVQIETAMGAAIDAFEGAQAIRVPRRRFAPVKTTNDLLALRSDAYLLTEEAHVVLAPQRDGRGAPLVDLDADHFKLIRDFDAHFPAGPPSLVGADRLTVAGDVVFGRDVVVRGTVRVEAGAGRREVEDGTVLEG